MFKSLFTVPAVLGLALLAVALCAPDLLPHGGAAGIGLAFAGIVNANLPPRFQQTLVGVAADPQNLAASTVTSGWVNMATFEAVQAIIGVGVLGALGTVDAKLQQASDSTGTGAKDVTGKAITQITSTASPTADSNNQQATIDCRQEELDIANGFSYVRLSLTVGIATSQVVAYLLGFYPVQGPATGLVAASLRQQV